MIAVLYNSLCQRLISENVDKVRSCQWASGLKAPHWLCVNHCSIMTFTGFLNFFLNSKWSQNRSLPGCCHKITARIFSFTPFWFLILIAKTWSQLSVGGCEMYVCIYVYAFLISSSSVFLFREMRPSVHPFPTLAHAHRTALALRGLLDLR